MSVCAGMVYPNGLEDMKGGEKPPNMWWNQPGTNGGMSHNMNGIPPNMGMFNPAAIGTPGT